MENQEQNLQNYNKIIPVWVGLWMAYELFLGCLQWIFKSTFKQWLAVYSYFSFKVICLFWKSYLLNVPHVISYLMCAPTTMWWLIQWYRGCWYLMIFSYTVCVSLSYYYTVHCYGMYYIHKKSVRYVTFKNKIFHLMMLSALEVWTL